MSLQDELNKWLASSTGQKRVREEQAKTIKAGKSFGQGREAISMEKAKAIGRRMRELYHQNLPDGISGGDGLRGSISPSSIKIGSPKILTDGGIRLEVSLPEELKHRDSLAYPNDRSHGAYDIIGLLTFGWDSSSGRIRGAWHENEIWNRTSRPPSDFMQDAVDQFNAEYGAVAYAELDGKYIL